MASSWRRPSTRTRSRLATFAHATSRTMAMEPMRTHSTLPISPTTSCFKERSLGAILAFINMSALKPSGAGKLRMVMPSSRAMSALACSMVTPGLSRARPFSLKLPSLVLLRSHWKGIMREASGALRKWKPLGSTPMICRDLPSMVMEVPMTDVAPPNFCCQ